MATFFVTATTWANTAHTITANTPEEAVEKALDEVPTLCHQCTGGQHGLPELEIGDDLEITGIHDEDGTEYPHEPTELDRLRAEVKTLRARIKELDSEGGVVNNVVGDVAPGAVHVQGHTFHGHISL